MISTALKPPGQSINAQQNKDDRRCHSAKEAAAYRDSLFIFFTGNVPLLQAMVEYYPAYFSGRGSASRRRVPLASPLVNEVPDT